MKKVYLILMIIISTLATNVQAKTIHIPNIDRMVKVVDMYKRYDSNPQPQFKTNKKGVELLNQVNDYFNNHIQYKLDVKGADYWQSPLETSISKTGDCEDYAIAKWQALLNNGIPEKDMLFRIGKHDIIKLFHTTLMVKLDGKTYYLDSTTNDINKNMLTEAMMYTINRFGFDVFVDDEN